MKIVNCRTLFFLFLLVVITACDTEEADVFDSFQQDPLLVGKWVVMETDVTNNGADQLTLLENGKGTYIKGNTSGALRWGTRITDEIRQFRLELDDGPLSEEPYEISGAALILNGEKYYTMDIPILGEWFLDTLHPKENGSQLYDCAYHFLSYGSLICKHFDESGFVRTSNGTWYRTGYNEVMLIVSGKKSSLSYRIENNVLTTNTGDSFLRNNKRDLYGEWMSVYDEKGKVVSGQYPYSLLNMFRWSYDEKNHIGIDYFTQDGEKRSREYIWNAYNDNLLHLHMDDDELVLNYRFRYDFSDGQFYLELSKDGQEDFSQFVGYARIGNAL